MIHPAHFQKLHQQQQSAAQVDALQAILNQPTPWLEPLLAEDARSLLLTPKFVIFVQSLLAEMAVQPQEFSDSPQLSADLSLWLLPSLPLPLRLHRLPAPSTANLTQVQMELGTWQQVFQLPIADRTDDEPATEAWATIAAQLHKTRVQLPIAAELQVFLAQELMAILSYLSEFEVEFLVSS